MLRVSLRSISPATLRLAQTSESNVLPAEFMMPTTTHLRGPKRNVSPIAERRLAEIVAHFASDSFAEHCLDILLVAAARHRLHAGAHVKPPAPVAQTQFVNHPGQLGIFHAAHLHHRRSGRPRPDAASAG